MVDLLENSPPNMPDYDNEEDEAFPPLPPPLSPGQGRQEDGELFADGEGSADVSNLADVPVAKRRVVKRPQPKLDANRLTSDRGLPALRTLFDNVRFKGKGHEGEDLRLLMQKMENWAHRLYPKLQFDDFIDKVEKLGSKKEVQTCLKRIRLDMPLIHEDYIGTRDEEDAATEPHIFKGPETHSNGTFTSDPQGPIHSTPAPNLSTPAPTASPALSLTEEQCRLIELNRQQALERKLARQQQAAECPAVDETSIVDELSIVSSRKSPNNSQDLEEDLNVDPSSIIHNLHQLSPTNTDPSEIRSEMTESG